VILANIGAEVKGVNNAIHAATSIPIWICPSAPIFHIDALNAITNDKPMSVRIKVSFTTVGEIKERIMRLNNADGGIPAKK